jgi:phosphoglycerol transferase MdoB-like AlkP superfamily enzyme
MSIESFNLWRQNLPLGVILLAVIWSLAWKGVALWKSGRKNQLVWFIVLLVVNTLGILEILYIFVFSKCCKKKELPQQKQNKR